ncbi:hypothetical protein [Rhodalgimonas zhirmunskyi]|uniref:Uncharacterized protein n=1 Tax=Rhodalgimonas zhirmunskyi TaxID=2964767 RepID=A0AAJ1U5L3_9RHOB|nr:hypothetical protein [Rhodoalgimonas zhirmunskyi]MDQ2093560.1 hypothetical protein [Rhodoalgimonas zhirmunskyi]
MAGGMTRVDPITANRTLAQNAANAGFEPILTDTALRTNVGYHHWVKNLQQLFEFLNGGFGGGKLAHFRTYQKGAFLNGLSGVRTAQIMLNC